jgi:outer membrane protein
MKYFSLLFFILIVESTLYSQTKTLSLNEAISLAMQKNTSMITSRNAVESQESNQRVAYGALFPSVSASAGWSRSQVPESDFGSSASNSFSAGLDASITFFDGFANFAALEIAELNVNVSRLSGERREQQTKYETVQFYLNVLRTEQLLNVRKDNLKRSNEQLKRIQESQKLGGVAMADVFRQQVIVSNDELALIQAQNDYDKAKVDLISYLGLDPLDVYEFKDNSIPTEVDEQELKQEIQKEQNLQSLSMRAFSTRSDFVSSEKNVTSARLGVAYAQGNWYPSLSAFSSLGYGGAQFGKVTFDRLSWGLRASYSLFDNFRRENSIQQAAIDLRNADEQLRLKERQVKSEIRKAVLDLDAARKSVEVSQTGVRSAIEDRRIAEEKYNLGAGTLLDKLVADANYTSAAYNKVNAVFGYVLAKKNLEFVIGTLK